jgi:DUF4097 and DUF4098 domain-containing protein YvlB
MRPACSPSDTAQAIKVTPIEDFVNNLVISQANFPVKDDKVRIHERRLKILKGSAERVSVTHFHIDSDADKVELILN